MSIASDKSLYLARMQFEQCKLNLTIHARDHKL